MGIQGIKNIQGIQGIQGIKSIQGLKTIQNNNEESKKDLMSSSNQVINSRMYNSNQKSYRSYRSKTQEDEEEDIDGDPELGYLNFI